MLNKIWVLLVIAAVIIGAFTGNLDKVSNAALDGAKNAVTLAISMLGVMCFWMGLVKILDKSGAMKVITKILKPALKLLFPEDKDNNEAKEAASMNISANFLGIGNAATPLGIKAMQAFMGNSKNNIATNSMVMFVVLNTASVQLLPTTIIAIRSAAGAKSPAAILPAVWCTSAVSVLAGILTAKVFEKLWI